MKLMPVGIRRIEIDNGKLPQEASDSRTSDGARKVRRMHPGGPAGVPEE